MANVTRRRRALLEEVLASDGDRLWAYLRALLRDFHQAEDAFQEIFMRALVAQARLNDQAAVRAYLFKSARNAAIDAFRRRTTRREVALATAPAAPEESGGPREDLTRLHLALADLSPEERDLLAMKYDAGLTYAEIAHCLEEPLGTVLARAHRTLKKLAGLMRKKEGSQDVVV